ncbi:WecB/TagA/CpsF family glycosyltransferase [Cecembia lonarensis]|uniref:Putative N-acetylmannosaminyltransferase n=1 Tax=Cecembia lonarensis (strain CCUG 58316 / KCTC 22772 / LW9) TaxID=1225176 RepID=K1M532_CECL9|nr:WecB/TagA/CpsF family glycosyltransferase [Cecembia lonarensis]EKB51304.1 Putative N-acetylmannosaminyltransferase [Cecembia lonarensis LW9]
MVVSRSIDLKEKKGVEVIPGYQCLEVLGYDVFSGKLDIIQDTSCKVLINTMSPNSYGVALKDKLFEKALKGSDLLVLDGVGVAFGSLLLNGKNIKKIAGQDCFDYFLELSNKNGWRVFFLGSTDDTLKKMKSRALNEYPNIKVEYFSPPFKPEFDEEDNSRMVTIINDFQPNVLFVGLTAPKQEKWAFQHKEKVNAGIISTVGNVFDWYAGNSKRPAKIWIKLRLEWLVRIFLRPEIFRRNTKNQMMFLRDLFLHILHIKRIK